MHVFLYQFQINEVRASLGSLPDKLFHYASDASIARYLTARNWNVQKATKMVKETLKWQLEYEPDKIRWVSKLFALAPFPSVVFLKIILFSEVLISEYSGYYEWI